MTTKLCYGNMGEPVADALNDWSLAEMPADWIDNQSHWQMMVSYMPTMQNYRCLPVW